MRDHSKKEPLYRKVNTKALHMQWLHRHGSDFRHERNTKAMQNFEGSHKSMKKDVNRGLDYTPLYKFLLSKVGSNWVEVHKEAISRLDKEEPIYHLVAKSEDERTEYVRIGDNTYYSGLFIDETGILQKVNPDFKNEDIVPSCSCCTHSFNGKPLNKKPKVTPKDLT